MSEKIVNFGSSLCKLVLHPVNSRSYVKSVTSHHHLILIFLHKGHQNISNNNQANMMIITRLQCQIPNANPLTQCFSICWMQGNLFFFLICHSGTYWHSRTKVCETGIIDTNRIKPWWLSLYPLIITVKYIIYNHKILVWTFVLFDIQESTSNP